MNKYSLYKVSTMKLNRNDHKVFTFSYFIIETNWIYVIWKLTNIWYNKFINCLFVSSTIFIIHYKIMEKGKKGTD